VLQLVFVGATVRMSIGSLINV